jgi:hypothetical protein
MGRTTRGLALALTFGLAAAAALAQDKVPTIKEIMARLNKPGGLYPTVSRELKSDNVDWNELRQQAGSFAKLAAALGGNTPPTGEPESWARLTKAYADSARALDDAAGRKDHAAANAARARLGGEACKTCHKAHKKK